MKINFFVVATMMILTIQAMEKKKTNLSQFEVILYDSLGKKVDTSQKISSLKDEYDSDDEDANRLFKSSRQHLALFKQQHLSKKNTAQDNNSTKHAQ